MVAAKLSEACVWVLHALLWGLSMRDVSVCFMFDRGEHS